MADSRDQFRDYITPVNCPSNNCGWVDLRHQFRYPDDKGQTEPAAGAHFVAWLPNGERVDGELNDKGEASFRSTGHGTVVVEYEPTIDVEIQQLQKEIKQALDAIIVEEKAETAKIQQEYEQSNWLGKRWEDSKAVGRGIASFFAALWDMLIGIGEAILAVTSKVGEYVLDPLNAPETFKEDVAAIKEKYDALKEFADEDLEVYFTLMQDKATWNMLSDFADDYLEAQHYSEYLEGGVAAAVGVILTIVTAGGGAAAAAGNAGARLSAIAAKIAPKLQKIAKLIKRRRAKKKVTDRSNKRITTTLLLDIKCFAPRKSARASYKKRYPPDGINPQGRDIDQEFDWQLKKQQDGINQMSPDELIAGIDSYNGKRNSSKPDRIKEASRKKIVEEKIKELKANGINENEAKTLAKEHADKMLAHTNALHNPDGVAGGGDFVNMDEILQNPTEHIGDEGVNKSLGSQWAKDKRVAGLREAAVAAKARGDKKMNIKLPRCGK